MILSGCISIMDQKEINKKKNKISKPPVLYSKTQKLVEELESKLGSTLLCYWNSPNGSVCGNDVVAFYEILKSVKSKNELYLYIKSDGGNGKASLRIIHLLRNYFKKITALVPLECASAATMLALGADKILMGPLAYLSAVDTSLTHDLSPIDKNNNLVSVSQDELSRVIKLWNTQARTKETNPYFSLYSHIHPLVFGAVDRASSLSIKLCNDILSYHMKDKKKAALISNQLNSNYPSHSYPITISEAKKIGLNVEPLDKSLNDLFLELNILYSEMGQRAYTDFDEFNYHDNEILNIVEGKKIQVFFQTDKDWHYRKEERRWVAMNDNSSWRKNEPSGKTMKTSILHIR